MKNTAYARWAAVLTFLLILSALLSACGEDDDPGVKNAEKLLKTLSDGSERDVQGLTCNDEMANEVLIMARMGGMDPKIEKVSCKKDSKNVSCTFDAESFCIPNDAGEIVCGFGIEAVSYKIVFGMENNKPCSVVSASEK